MLCINIYALIVVTSVTFLVFGNNYFYVIGIWVILKQTRNKHKTLIYLHKRENIHSYYYYRMYLVNSNIFNTLPKKCVNRVDKMTSQCFFISKAKS